MYTGYIQILYTCMFYVFSSGSCCGYILCGYILYGYISGQQKQLAGDLHALSLVFSKVMRVDKHVWLPEVVYVLQPANS